MVQISLQNSGGKVVFLGGSMDPSQGTNGRKKYLGRLKVLNHTGTCRTNGSPVYKKSLNMGPFSFSHCERPWIVKMGPFLKKFYKMDRDLNTFYSFVKGQNVRQ